MKQGKISFIGLFLSIFFGLIVFTILFVVCNILAQPYFELKLIFTLINICIVVFLATCGGILCSKITVPMFTAISISTVIYTIIQFLSLIIVFSLDRINFYLISQMVLLFVYFAITLPLAKTGYNIAQKNQ